MLVKGDIDMKKYEQLALICSNIQQAIEKSSHEELDQQLLRSSNFRCNIAMLHGVLNRLEPENMFNDDTKN